MKTRIAGFFLLLLSSLAMCMAQTGENFSERFGQIRILEKKDVVLSRLGKPKLISSSNMLGIKHETLTWQMSGGVYVITFVAGHVYGTKEKVADPE